MWVLVLLACIALAAGAPQNSGRIQDSSTTLGFICPDRDGLYEDPNQCDKYWSCEFGEAVEHMCDDGLVADPIKLYAEHADPCDSMFVVDCTDRPILQPATNASEFCPRRHGVFADPDPTDCQTYHVCKEGYKENTHKCESALRYNPTSGTCDWPKGAGRTNCRTLTDNCVPNGDTEFCCTGDEVFDSTGRQTNPHPTFPDPLDCQKFFVCLNRVKPQVSSCNAGMVYSIENGLCVEASESTDCKGWYRDHPDFAEYYEYYEYTDEGTQLDAADTAAAV